MSDVMFYGVLRMPYELVMSDELSRRQFYSRAQEAADRVAQLEADAASRAAPSSPVADDGLPELPEPTSLGWNAATAGVTGYTADQMRQAQREAVAADRRALEVLHLAEMAKWARDNELNVPAAWDATSHKFPKDDT